ncbi:MAG: hypothetical protein LC648_10220, partial [Novosphingobium sp.]|nr:hypothetical protein [Novosphingobium sp.]
MSQAGAFEFRLRTGRLAAGNEDRKFNPWHDPEDGRFTFAQQGRFYGPGGGSADAQMTQPPQSRPAPKRPGQAATPRRQRQPAVPDLEAGQREAFKKHVVPFEGDRDIVDRDSLGYL